MTGYESKKAAAQDKMTVPDDAPSATYKEIMDSMNTLRQGTSIQTQVYKEMKNKKLYFDPPQRPWVGLTYQERRELWDGAIKYLPSDARIHGFAKDIEAKLKEKNT